MLRKIVVEVVLILNFEQEFRGIVVKIKSSITYRDKSEVFGVSHPPLKFWRYRTDHLRLDEGNYILLEKI